VELSNSKMVGQKRVQGLIFFYDFWVEVKGKGFTK
jgi:hypothetical protein